MGRNNDKEDPVFSSTVCTSPSSPWITLTIWAKCHFPLGRSWSTTSTRSPTCAFCRGLCHFCLSCRAGTYSFNLRLQKWSANICVCLHFFLNSISSFTKVPGGKLLTVLCNNRLFGVNDWRSLGSSETALTGRIKGCLNFFQDSRQYIFFHKTFSKHSFQGGSSATDQPFPYSTGMRSLTWLKHPLAPSLQEFISDLALELYNLARTFDVASRLQILYFFCINFSLY